MARRTFLVQLLFSLALISIISFNRSGSTSSVFPWTKVRYQPGSSPPDTPDHGTCPGLATTTKPALVVARVSADGDPSWLEPLADKYHICVYTADASPSPSSSSSDDTALPSTTHPKQWRLRTPANRGHEAMSYLTFLTSNHASLPAAGAVFIHGSRFAWHNDNPLYDNQALLAALNVSAALEPAGYHNLRCDWSAGTCSSRVLSSQASLEVAVQARVSPWDVRAVSDRGLPRALGEIFGGEGGGGRFGPGHAVRAQCCAQFVVSRESMWMHGREEYEGLRRWLLDGMEGGGRRKGAAPGDDRVAGRILSYVWHILFLQKAHFESGHGLSGPRDAVDLERLNQLACPSAGECYCRLYGLCDLKGCRGRERCHGQYQLPKHYRLPENWTATHS